MKRTKLKFEKRGGKLIPLDMAFYLSMRDSINDGEIVEAIYQTSRNGKSKEQLGYLYAVVYPFILYHFKEAQGDVLYYRSFGEHKYPVLATVETLDTLMKDMYAESAGEEVKKSRMNQKELSDYIAWLDKFCSENFEATFPEPYRRSE